MFCQNFVSRFTRWIAVSLLGISLLLGGDASANPNSDDSNVAMKAHGTIEGAAQRVAQLYEKFFEWEKLAADSMEKAQRQGRIPHSQLSRIYADINRGIWFSKDLQSMGEPAGKDLEVKYTQLRNEFRKFATVLKEFHQKKIAELKKQTPKRVKELERIKQLIGSGKLMEAEGAIQKLHLSQLPAVFYLTNQQASPYETPVATVHNQSLEQIAKVRRADFAKKAEEKIVANQEAIKLLGSEATRLASELASSQKVKLGADVEGDAADAIDYLATLWGNASAAVNRSYGIALAYRSGTVDSISQAFRPVVTRVENTAIEGLKSIINSAAKSTPADQVKTLYPRVLKNLTAIDRRYYGDLERAVTEPLQNLAKMDSTLAGSVQTYSRATQEPLRWMKRFALRQRQSLSNGYPTTDVLLGAKKTPKTSSKPGFYGGPDMRQRVLTPSSFGIPASWVVGAAASIVGEKVRQDDVLRIVPSQPKLVGPQTARGYTNIDSTLALDTEMQFLRNSLLIGTEHPPLDYAAADADSSAERHEFSMVGGEVSKVWMEPLVTRIATIPDVAHMLVPLGSLAPINPERPAMGQTLWRIDIKPQWVVHPLFVAVAK